MKSLSDPSGLKLETNHVSVFICVSGIAVWHMYYDSIVRVDTVISLPLHVDISVSFTNVYAW